MKITSSIVKIELICLPVLFWGIFCSQNSGIGNYVNPQNPENYGPAEEATNGTCPAQTVLCKNGNWCCPADTICLQNPDDQLGCGQTYCCLACEEELPCGLGCCPEGMKCAVNPAEDSPCTTALCCRAGNEEEQPETECPETVANQCADGTTCIAAESPAESQEAYACYTADGEEGAPGETLCLNGQDFCSKETGCIDKIGLQCADSSTNENYCCGPVDNPETAANEEPCGTGVCSPNKVCVQNSLTMSGCTTDSCCQDNSTTTPTYSSTQTPTCATTTPPTCSSEKVCNKGFCQAEQVCVTNPQTTASCTNPNCCFSNVEPPEEPDAGHQDGGLDAGRDSGSHPGDPDTGEEDTGHDAGQDTGQDAGPDAGNNCGGHPACTAHDQCNPLIHCNVTDDPHQGGYCYTGCCYCCFSYNVLGENKCFQTEAQCSSGGWQGGLTMWDAADNVCLFK